MESITGVHGIAQGLRTTSERLSAEWTEAARRGLRDLDRAELAPAMVVPYLTPLLMAPKTTLGPDDDPIVALADVDPDELAFVTAGLDDVLADLSAGEIDALAQEATVLGIPRVPAGLTRQLRAVDGRWRDTGALLVRLLREVYAYLWRPEVGARVRRRVQVNTVDGTRVVIGHSLGSVIAYDLLRRGDLTGVTTLITCGSPLAWPTIRRGLAESWPASRKDGGGTEGRGLPGVTWTNVYAPADPVTAGHPLAPVWTQVTDHPVSNPWDDAHGVGGYLTQPSLATALAQALSTGPGPGPSS